MKEIAITDHSQVSIDKFRKKNNLKAMDSYYQKACDYSPCWKCKSIGRIYEKRNNVVKAVEFYIKGCNAFEDCFFNHGTGCGMVSNFNLTKKDSQLFLSLSSDEEKKLFLLIKNPDLYTIKKIYGNKGIENISEKMKLSAMQKNPSLIQFLNIKKIPEHIQIKLIQNDTGRITSYGKYYCPIITYIPNPTEKVQLLAIKKDPSSIEYIKNPTEEMQLLAVKQNYKAIKYIKDPTEKAQLLVIEKGPSLIKYITNPTEKVQLLAIKENPFSIKYIKNPSEKVQLLAVKTNYYVDKHIKNPTEKVKEYVRKNKPVIKSRSSSNSSSNSSYSNSSSSSSPAPRQPKCRTVIYTTIMPGYSIHERNQVQTSKYVCD